MGYRLTTRRQLEWLDNRVFDEMIVDGIVDSFFR